jgi:hypothetical protein
VSISEQPNLDCTSTWAHQRRCGLVAVCLQIVFGFAIVRLEWLIRSRVISFRHYCRGFCNSNRVWILGEAGVITSHYRQLCMVFYPSVQGLTVASFKF